MNNAMPLGGLLEEDCRLRSCHRCHKWLIVFCMATTCVPQTARMTTAKENEWGKVQGKLKQMPAN